MGRKKTIKYIRKILFYVLKYNNNKKQFLYKPLFVIVSLSCKKKEDAVEVNDKEKMKEPLEDIKNCIHYYLWKFAWSVVDFFAVKGFLIV